MLFLWVATDAVFNAHARKLASVFFVLIIFAVVACERNPVVMGTSASPPVPPTVAVAVTANNAVATYFNGAEVQAETDAQRAELRKAFADMLTLPVDDLRIKRYADFAGSANQRTVVELIANHVVPSTPQTLDASVFFAEVKSPQTQIALRAKLDELNKSSAPAKP